MIKQIMLLTIALMFIVIQLDNNICFAADDAANKTTLTVDMIFKIGIKELKKQDKKYFEDKYEFFKLSKNGTYWRFEFKRKNDLMTGQYGSISITEDGKIAHYFGGM